SPRCADRAARHGRYRGTLSRPAAGLADPHSNHGSGSARRDLGRDQARPRFARGARARPPDQRRAGGPDCPGRRSPLPGDGRSAYAPASVATTPDLAAARPGPARAPDRAMTLEIRAEQPGEEATIRAINDAAFGNVDDESAIVDRLRGTADWIDGGSLV